MSARAVFLAAGAALALALAGGAIDALAQVAPADTTVEDYVRSMADSTDAWFGISAQASDTTGLDSLRAWAVEHPGKTLRSRGGTLSLAPLLGFNRAVGGAMGAEAGIGRSRRWGRVEAGAQWANGPGLWFGSGVYTRRWNPRAGEDPDENGSTLALRAHRAFEGLDRDYFDPVLSSTAAFVFGTDRSHYLRRDGVRGAIDLRRPAGWIRLGGRVERESPLVTTATWNLFSRTPVVVRNDAAAEGRVREADLDVGARLPRAPITLEAHAWTAGGALGGDFDYTRLRLAAGGALALGRHVAFAPQLEYGRLTGTALPQDAFYLGGGTLHSLDANALQGTGRALAHADWIVLEPLQSLLGLERSPAFPIQIGAFAGAGAVWGRDPATGRARLTARDWPERTDWLAEAGLSLLYRPGLPHPDSFVRVDWAVPIGADERRPSFYLSYTRSLNFLH